MILRRVFCFRYSSSASVSSRSVSSSQSSAQVEHNARFPRSSQRGAPQMSQSRGRARVLHEKKKRGLRKGPGRKSGSARARVSKKEAWMKRIRALRRRLRDLKANRVITQSVYRRLYDMAGSGAFESTADLERYIKTRGLGRKR